MQRDKSYDLMNGRDYIRKEVATMEKAPAIVLVMSKEELLRYMQSNNAEVSLYGCPSGNKYSNCHNS